MQAFMVARGVFGWEMKILRGPVYTYTDSPSEQSQYTHLFCVIMGHSCSVSVTFPPGIDMVSAEQD